MEHQRLSSLTIKRDLSLGGSKPKKVYKPNLNAVRNKDKSKEMIKLAQEQAKQKKERQIIRQNFRKEQQKNIQVSGVFSQGFGTGERRHTGGSVSFKDSEVQSAPKIRKKWSWDSSTDEKEDYEPLINKNDGSSDEEGEYQPIRLPLYTNTESFLKSHGDKPEQFLQNGRVKADFDVKHNKFTTKYKIYDDEQPCLSLIKLPNSLSGKGFDENEAKVDYNLSHMVEGKIGMLKVRQSGKMEVHIGNMVYVLESVGDDSFKEQLVYVPANLKLSFGKDISTLGNVNDKYMLLPYWNDLFERKNISSRQKPNTATGN